MQARRLVTLTLLAAGFSAFPSAVCFAQGNTVPDDSETEAPSPERTIDLVSPTGAPAVIPEATSEATSEATPPAPDSMRLKPSLSFGGHFGGRFVDSDDAVLLGTPPVFGLSLGFWFPVGRQSTLGLHVEANASFAERALVPLFNNKGSKLVAFGFGVPAFLQYGWRPWAWFRMAAGAGGFWHHQQAYIDNPRAVGDDFFADRYMGAAFRFAFEFPTHAGSVPVVPSLAVSHFQGKGREPRTLRYSGKSFAFGGPETTLIIGIAISTPSNTHTVPN